MCFVSLLLVCSFFVCPFLRPLCPAAKKGNKVGPGAIAGIVIAVVVAIGAVIGAMYVPDGAVMSASGAAGHAYPCSSLPTFRRSLPSAWRKRPSHSEERFFFPPKIIFVHTHSV